jgi:hypothetical protein
MPTDDDAIAILHGIKEQVVDLGILLRDPRTPAGARKRATRALSELTTQALDLMIAKLGARQPEAPASAPVEDELV